ncbi:restriction endonuclease subunit S [Pseudoalteromonas porphyrae]|uniref:restriction endonuclease subunit S n=1 Tax=Pseudoalteromonas porphyrae TaxID=187330 RepID=UPI0006BAA796|nr:restriction endonuclease subunit S [Pseudoalteromonas porphyrae]
MGSNWVEYKLAEIAILRNGAGIKQQFFSESSIAIPLVKVSNFTSNSVDVNGLTKVDHEHAKKWTSHTLDVEDIVVATVGSWPPNWSSVVGKVVRIPQLAAGAIQNQNTCAINPKDNMDKDFLYYVLKTDSFINYVINVAQGSANQARVPVKKLGEFKFKAPFDIDKQRKLVNILVNADKKIELNQKTNQTLEQMAQALFKSWFVDYDPVFDNLLASADFNLDNLETSLPDELKQKAQRRLVALNSLHNAAECKASLSALAHELQAQLPTKEATQAAVQVSEKAAKTPVKANFNANPDILAQHANTHAHFPNEFVHNEQLGWIPKGWEKSQIQDLAKVVKGKSYKSAELSDSSTALVTLKSFKRGGGYRLDGLKGYTGKYKPEQEVFAGDLIVAYTDVTQAADVIGKPAMVISDTKYEHLVVSLDVAVVRCFNEIHKNYLYGVMKTDAFQNHSRSYTSGTTVLHLKKEAVPEYCLALPDNEILSAFLGVSAPLYEKIDRLIDENRALTKLRDTLLPKLISGELEIPDVATDEKAVD